LTLLSCIESGSLANSCAYVWLTLHVLSDKPLHIVMALTVLCIVNPQTAQWSLRAGAICNQRPQASQILPTGKKNLASADVLSVVVGMLCRQQRAALCIQRNWRRYQARKVYLLYRRRVVRLQCAWRSKLARRELRQRRASQREAGKLIQVSTVESPDTSCMSSHSCQSLLCYLMYINLVVSLYVILCVSISCSYSSSCQYG